MEPKKEKCPHAETITVGDESEDRCEIDAGKNVGSKCVREHGQECETYNEILKEWEEEEE